MNKNCFVLFLISLSSIFSLIFCDEVILLNNTGGVMDISYQNNTENILLSTLSFSIPLEPHSSMPETIKLELSEPSQRNGAHCFAQCSYENKLNCQIKKEECDSIDYDSKIVTVLSINDPNNYKFVNEGALTNYISFQTHSIEMTCSNFKLSFFFEYRELKNHPYEKEDFSIPINYKEKKGEAKCILPKQSSYIACIIDAGNTLFQKDDFIEFETNKPIKINDDLNLSLNIEKYKLEDDCGKDTSNSNYINKFSFIKIMNILSLIYFMIWFMWNIKKVNSLF